MAQSLAILLALAASSEAFSPPSPYGGLVSSSLQTAQRRRTPKNSLYVSSLQKEETLTDADEDVLFGGSAVSPRNRKVSKIGAILPDNGSPPNPLDHSTDPLVNKLRTMRETVTSCPSIWKELAANCPEKRALFDEHLCDEKIDLTFEEMENKVRRSAAAFKSLGVKKGVNVAILGENSAMWLIADHGIQLAGGASAVRGADAPLDELRYIYEHSDSAGIAVLQDVKLLQKLAKDAKAKSLGALGLRNDSFGPVKTVVLLHRGKTSDDEIDALGEANGVSVKVLSDLLDSTSPASYKELPIVERSDLSTSKFSLFFHYFVQKNSIFISQCTIDAIPTHY